MIHSVSHQAPGEAIDLWAEDALVEHPNAKFSSPVPAAPRQVRVTKASPLTQSVSRPEKGPVVVVVIVASGGLETTTKPRTDRRTRRRH